MTHKQSVNHLYLWLIFINFKKLFLQINLDWDYFYDCIYLNFNNMKNSILNLSGVKIIDKSAQSKVNGGGSHCSCGAYDYTGTCLCQISV